MYNVTENEIYEMARMRAIEIWDKEYRRLQNMPKNKVAIAREKLAYERIAEIESMMIAKFGDDVILNMYSD